MPEVNIPLLRKAVEWVEAEDALPPRQSAWNQAEYVLTPALRSARAWCSWAERGMDAECGTAYCVAGKIAADHDPRYRRSAVVDDVCAREVAADLLGIDADDSIEAGGLFAEDNTAADVRRIAEELAGEPL